jgi:NTP pyrophosphatase (non-canonical NTP hydrolase)
MNTSKLHTSKLRVDLYDGTLNGYQKAAITTAIYPGQGTFNGLIYTTLKLNGEAGELAEKVGKVMRDDLFMISEQKRELCGLELGDALWYIAASAKELGYTLEDIAEMNLNKLKSRQERNKLSGSGDNR